MLQPIDKYLVDFDRWPRYSDKSPEAEALRVEGGEFHKRLYNQLLDDLESDPDYGPSPRYWQVLSYIDKHMVDRKNKSGEAGIKTKKAFLINMLPIIRLSAPEKLALVSRQWHDSLVADGHNPPHTDRAVFLRWVTALQKIPLLGIAHYAGQYVVNTQQRAEEKESDGNNR